MNRVKAKKQLKQLLIIQPIQNPGRFIYLSCLVVVFLIGLFFSYLNVSASFPRIINYQGRLTGTGGSPVADGSYNLSFKLFDVDTGGTALWTEIRCKGDYTDPANPTCSGTGTDNRIALSKGLFSTLLGSINTFGTLSFNQDLYLEIDIGGSGDTPSWTTLTPRKRLGTASSSLESEKLGGKDESLFATLGEEEIVTAPWRFNVNSTDPGIIINQAGTGNGLTVNGTTTLSNDTYIMGNLGIGTTSPTSPLTIAGTNPSETLIDTTASSYTKLTKLNTNNEVRRENDVLSSTDLYTKLLLHMDGNFTDSSLSPHTVTAYGTATNSATEYVFGTGSYEGFNFTGSYLSSPASEDWNFGTGNFTIDFRFKLRNSGAGIDQGLFQLTSNYTHLTVYDWVGNVYVVINNNYGSYGYIVIPSPSINTWYHLAIVRDGDIITVYVDGVSKWSGDFTGISIGNSTDPIKIGQYYNSGFTLGGYIDELRVSKGIARWTTGFTLPVTEYSSSSATTLIYSSSDSTDSSEKGIQTYGDYEGRSVLQGKTIRFNIGPNEKIKIDANGNLGLGTSFPATKTDVLGTIAVTSIGSTFTVSKSATVVTSTSGTFAFTDVGKLLVWANGTVDVIATYTDTTHVTVNSSATISSQVAYTKTPSFYIVSDGKIGVGTANLTSTFTINAADPSEILVDSASGSYAKLKKFNTDNKATMYNSIFQEGGGGGTGMGLDFDGSDDHVSLGNDSSIPSGDTSFSVAFWWKPKVISGAYTAIITKTTSANWNNGWGVWHDSSGYIRLYLTNYTFNAYHSIAVDGNWHFVVGTWDSSTGNVKIYYDNVAGTGTVVGGTPSSGPLEFGYGAGGNNWLNASLDEVAIYGTVLSVSEVSSLWNSGNGYQHTGSESGLISVWHLDETSGTSTADSKGTNTGTLYGFSPPACWVTGYIYGAGSSQEAQVWDSQDSPDLSEKGIQTYGELLGRSILQGQTIRFNFGLTEAMRVDASGRLGIGTTTPDSILHVIGGVCIESSDSGCAVSMGNLKVGGTIESVGAFQFNGASGITQTLNLRDQSGSGDCTVGVTNGIITSNNCN